MRFINAEILASGNKMRKEQKLIQNCETFFSDKSLILREEFETII